MSKDCLSTVTLPSKSLFYNLKYTHSYVYLHCMPDCVYVHLFVRLCVCTILKRITVKTEDSQEQVSLESFSVVLYGCIWFCHVSQDKE